MATLDSEDRIYLETMVGPIRTDVADLKHAVLTGNGMPGALSRLSTLEERTTTLGRFMAAIVGAILGYQFGPK